MYLSTALLLFLVSKFTYSSPPRSETTSRAATQWITFNFQLSEEVELFLQKARKTFRLFRLDRINIDTINFIKSFRKSTLPSDICHTETDEFSQVHLTQLGISECYNHCYKKNLAYKNLMNTNILQLAATFLVTGSDTTLRDPIQLETSDDDNNISSCVQARMSYECVCSPKHKIKVSRQFNDFVTTTLLRHSRENVQLLRIEEHFVAFVFVMKYYPKTAIFYLRWLTTHRLFLHLKSAPPTTYNGYNLLDSSSLEDGTDMENPNLNDDNHSFVHGDIELFNKLFNHIYSDRCDIASFFSWCDAGVDICCYLFGASLGFWIVIGMANPTSS